MTLSRALFVVALALFGASCRDAAPPGSGHPPVDAPDSTDLTAADAPPVGGSAAPDAAAPDALALDATEVDAAKDAILHDAPDAPIPDGDAPDAPDTALPPIDADAGGAGPDSVVGDAAIRPGDTSGADADALVVSDALDGPDTAVDADASLDADSADAEPPDSGAPDANAAPVVFITSPEEEAFVAGTVTVAVSTEGPVALVTIALDGASLTELASPPYVWEWDSGTVSEGPHVLTAHATTPTGKHTTHAVQVTVDRTSPEVAIIAPAPGALQSDSVEIVVSASDAALAGVELRWDGQLAVTLPAPPFATVLDVTALGSGLHALSATATDRAGNTATDTLDVLLDRPPAVTLTLPGGDGPLTGLVGATAQATDDLGLAEIRWALDGRTVQVAEAAGTTGEWVLPLDTTLLSMGDHTVVVEATDTSGLQTTAEATFAATKVAAVTLVLCSPGGACAPPAPGAVLTGGSWTAMATVEGPAEAVRFLVGGIPTSLLTEPPYALTLDPPSLPAGPTAITAEALAEGAVIGSATIAVIIVHCDDGEIDADGDGHTCGEDDCDDADPKRHKGAIEKPARCAVWADWAVVRQIEVSFIAPPVVDGAGAAHAIVWLPDASPSGFHYVTDRSGDWTLQAMPKWFDPIDPHNLVDDTWALRIDALGHAHLFWRAMACDPYRYATNASGEWVHTRLSDLRDATGPGQLALDRNGTPHVVAAHGKNKTQTGVIHSTLVSGAWVTEWTSPELVTASGNIYWSLFSPRLVVDRAFALRVLLPTDFDEWVVASNQGGAWSVGPVVASSWPLLATDALGDVRVVDQGLLLTTDVDGEPVWVTENVPFGPSWSSAAVLSRAGDQHVVYGSESPGSLFHASNVSGAWVTADLPIEADPELRWAVGLDDQQTPHVAAFVKAPATQLVHLSPSACVAWTAPADLNCSGATAPDEDGDGHDGIAFGGDDCGDAHPDVHPGAVEICGNAVDEDCSGRLDDRDGDSDGAVAAECGGPDCDDEDPGTHPGAAEICGTDADEDCSGALDDLDADGDGHLDSACGGDDCNDADASSHPGAFDATYCTAWSQWTVETIVATGTYVNSVSMSLDGLNLHVAYRQGDVLRVASGSSGAWTVDEVDQGVVGAQISVSGGGSEPVSVVYVRANDLVRATRGPGGWQPEIVRPGYNTPLSLPDHVSGKDGADLLIWATSGSLYAWQIGSCSSSFAAAPLDFASLGVRDGVWHIAFDTWGGPRHAVGAPGAFSDTPIEGINGLRGGPGIDSTGVPHVIGDAAGNTIVHAFLAGGAFATETVGPSDYGSPAPLAIDAEDGLHVVYRAVDDKALVYSTNAGGAWTTTTAATTAYGAMDSIVIAVDAWGRPHVVYEDSKLNELRYAWPEECVEFGPSPDSDCDGAE